MNCGLWIVDCGLRRSAATRSRARLAATRRGARWIGLAVALVAAIHATSSAQAQVDTTVAIDTPDNVARPGAYAPVRIRATNRTARSIWEVRLTSGGPVDVVVSWRIAPGETAEKILPVFYAGGDLRLSVEFADAAGNVIANAAPVPPPVHEVSAKTALMGLPVNLAEPDEMAQEAVRGVLGAESLRLVRLAPEAMAMALRCGMLDAIFSDAPPAATGRAAVARPGPPRTVVMATALPFGAQDVVQPEASRLFASSIWPAEDRRRLWLWLGVFALAVLAAGVLVPGRKAGHGTSRTRARAVVATAILVIVAAVAAATILFFGDVRLARVRDARVFYIDPFRTDAGLEHFVLLESRGGAPANFVLAQPGTSPFPVPVLAGSEDFFRKGGTLHVGSEEYFESREPWLLVHVLSTAEWRGGQSCPPRELRPTRADLAAVARRADVVAALLVDGSVATDAAGRSQPLEAWAVEWKADADPRLAYAGRSLSWWDRDRREGDGKVLLVWWHDAACPPAEAPPSLGDRSFPTLAVYSAE